MRKRLIGVLGVVLMLAGVLIALLGPWPRPVTRAAFDRIEREMTRAEVHAILGRPGDYRTCPVTPLFKLANSGEFIQETWSGDEGDICIWFDWRGTQVDRMFVASQPDDTGPAALAIWRLKRLEERFLR